MKKISLPKKVNAGPFEVELIILPKPESESLLSNVLTIFTLFTLLIFAHGVNP